MQAGKNAKANGQMGTAFHDLSEGLGFIYSLRSTHNPTTGQPYFNSAETEAMINSITGAPNGLWDVTAGSLDAISDTIANRFGFTVTQAAD